MSDAFALFQSDIDSQQLDFALDASKKLTVVAASIGAKRTVSELFPYLPNVLAVPSDEVLVAIGRQLYNIYDIGGRGTNPENSAEENAIILPIVINIIHQLAQEEEVLVRQAGIHAFKKIVPTLSQQYVTEHVEPMWDQLSKHESFGARHSATLMLPALFRASITSRHTTLRHCALSLAQDDSPLVRRAAALTIHELAGAMFVAIEDIMIHKKDAIDANGVVITQPTEKLNHIQSIYQTIALTTIPTLQQLSIDDREYLRSLVPSALAHLVPYITIVDYQNFILPLLNGLVDDVSWKVRQMVIAVLPTLIANLFKRIQYQLTQEIQLLPNQTEARQWLEQFQPKGAFDSQHLILSAFELFTKLLHHDNNIEVRSSAVLTLPDIILLAQGIIPPKPNTQLASSAPAQVTEEDSLVLDKQYFYLPQAAPGYKPATDEEKEFLDKAKLAAQAIPSLNPLPTGLQPFDTDAAQQYQSVLTTIGQALSHLTCDLTILAKVDLCESFAQISSYLSSDYIQEFILPVITTLAHDESVQVRSHVALCVGPVMRTFSPQIIIAKIWPIFDLLQQDARWRVRRAICTQMAPLVELLYAPGKTPEKSSVTFFETRIVPVIRQLLTENVHIVRNRMAAEFRSLTYLVGAQRILALFLPTIGTLFDPKSNYLQRITALHFVYYCTTSFYQAFSIDAFSADLLPFLIEGLQDKVANVRVLAARYLASLVNSKFVTKAQATQLFGSCLPNLASMAEDVNGDRESRLQGALALQLINQ